MKEQLVVSYFCLPINGVDDGQAIYDRNFIISLKKMGFIVNVYVLKTRRSLFSLFPVWNRTIIDIDESYLDKSKNTYVIISHEALNSLVKYIQPDLFIVHNLFCSFEFKSKPLIQFLYRFASKYIYSKTFKVSAHVLLLSYREKLIAEKKYSRSFLCEPPGLYLSTEMNEEKVFSKEYFKRCGSSEWLPKKASLIPDSIINNSFVEKGVVDINLAPAPEKFNCFGLIEDKFLSGFKLKFLQMYYEGNVILSNANLALELEGLRLDPSGYVYVEDFQMLNIEKIQTEDGLYLSNAELLKRREFMLQHYTWDKIVERVMLKITKLNRMK